MNYQIKLEKALEKLPINTATMFGDSSVGEIIQDIGSFFDLTTGEAEEIKELVRQVITREREPKDFEAGLKEKLEEDNREKVPEIVAVISEAIFSRLLPALNIKVPIELAVRVAPPKVEGLEVVVLAPAHPAQMKKMAPPSVPVPPPVMRSAIHQSYQASSGFSAAPSSKPQGLQTSTIKPPIMETSHESMATNPLESLMQMLEGKVSQKDLSRQFEKLPDSLKSALGSVDSAKKVVDIGRKYALHMDKLGELGAETGMVILGFTHPAEFLSRLTRRLGLSEEKVRPIAQEINTEVFLKIREALKQINGEDSIKVRPPETRATPTIPPSPVPTKSLQQMPQPEEQEKPKYQGEALINPTTSPIPIKPEVGLLHSETEEVLDREAILRDIENPTPTNSGFQTAVTKTQPIERPRDFAVEAKTPVSTPTESAGIPVKPRERTEPVLSAVTATVPPRIVPISKPTSPQIPTEARFVPVPKKETVEPLTPDRPAFGSTVPEKIPAPVVTPSTTQLPSTPKTEVPPSKPQNIIDQKLSGATSSTKSESNYTSDPYRESL